MIALSIIAVCLIAAAAVLGVRLSPSLRSADQRGDVSLQTLLIAGFSLLVLVQVASTLVIVLTDDGGSSASQQAAAIPPAAIPPSAAAPDPDGGAASTTSTTAADPDSAPTTSAPVVPVSPDACRPWEIFDPDTEAAGFGGPEGLGGIWSSQVGCVRVCYAQTWWGGRTRLSHFPPYRFINASTPEQLRGEYLWDADGDPLPSPVYTMLLEYSLTDIRLAPEEGQNDQYATYQIVSSTQASSNLDTTQNAEMGELIPVVNEGEEIRVSESGDACQHIQTNTGTEFVNSDISRTIRQPDDTTS